MTLPTSNPRAIGFPGPDTAIDYTGGTEDWSAWYTKLKDNKDTIKMDIDALSWQNSVTSIVQIRWSPVPQNVLVEGLHGCTAVIGVSHKGQSLIRCLHEATTS